MANPFDALFEMTSGSSLPEFERRQRSNASRSRTPGFLDELLQREPTKNADLLNLKLQLGREDRQKELKEQGAALIKQRMQNRRGSRGPGFETMPLQNDPMLPFGQLGASKGTTLLGY